MNKQVYADDPWRDIPFEEAQAIQPAPLPAEIDALGLVAAVIGLELKNAKQVSTQVNEVNDE